MKNISWPSLDRLFDGDFGTDTPRPDVTKPAGEQLIDAVKEIVDYLEQGSPGPLLEGPAHDALFCHVGRLISVLSDWLETLEDDSHNLTHKLGT